MLCDWPWSLLSKAMVNGLAAGPWSDVTTNAVFWAVSMTSALGRLGGGPDGSRPLRPPAATALASGPGAGAAEFGSSPELSSRPPARIHARIANDAVGQ